MSGKFKLTIQKVLITRNQAEAKCAKANSIYKSI
jgi:hypothetical protein